MLRKFLIRDSFVVFLDSFDFVYDLSGYLLHFLWIFRSGRQLDLFDTTSGRQFDPGGTTTGSSAGLLIRSIPHRVQEIDLFDTTLGSTT